ncbi:hypothetical protein ACMFMG_006135 [Clarireedia jacksonii]
MQITSILFLAIQATGVLSAPQAGNIGDAPDLSNSSTPPPGTLILSLPAVVSPLLPSDVISARNGAGKSVAMEDSGAGLLEVTDPAIGTPVATGDSAASSNHVARTAAALLSAVAVARVFTKGNDRLKAVVGSLG